MTLLRRAKAVETKLERAVSSVADGASPRIRVASTALPDSPKSAHRCGAEKAALRRVFTCSHTEILDVLLQVAAEHVHQAAQGAQRAADTAGGSAAEVQARMLLLPVESLHMAVDEKELHNSACMQSRDAVG